MEISACGLVCSECNFYGKECNGCIKVSGKPFWASEHTKKGVCPLYDCSVNEKGYKNCGGCSELPCNMFVNMKDPNSTDEEHRQGIIMRVNNLKAN